MQRERQRAGEGSVHEDCHVEATVGCGLVAVECVEAAVCRVRGNEFTSAQGRQRERQRKRQRQSQRQSAQ